MKKLLLLTLAVSLPLVSLARADNDKRSRHRSERDDDRGDRGDRSEQAAPASRTVRTVNPAVRQPVRRSVQNRSIPTQRTVNRSVRPVTPGQTRQAVRSEAQLDGRTRVQPSNQVNNRNRQVDRSRGHRNFDRNSFNHARTRVIRTRHDRNWWRNRYNTFILFGGGYYYWDAGYWFPAYGYSPYYNNYAYSEPIYGYDDLSPGQVIENVQLALRDEGYYPGAIDGLMGPQTRSALGAYQRDHGLVITEAVDEPTLVTLGLA